MTLKNVVFGFWFLTLYSRCIFLTKKDKYHETQQKNLNQRFVYQIRGEICEF